VLARWLIPAIAGGRPARIGAAVKVGLARAGLSLAILAGSNAKVNAAFKTYVAALIAHQRLACLKSQRGAKAHTAEGWDVFACENAGFYPIETSQETRFRWSEPIAIMSARLPEGRHQVRIECLSIRSPALAGLRFYVNGRPLPVRDVLFGLDTIDVTFDLSRPGRCSLGWTCLRGRVKGDSRWLGLPIKRIATDPAGD
jgi:hypothetical protein